MSDKGYDSDKLRTLLTAADGKAIIPTRVNKKNRPPFDRERYRQMNVIKRFLANIRKLQSCYTI